MTSVSDSVESVAIIGMAGRFPGAATVEQFWTNVRNGVESVSFFTEEELLAAGVDPAILRHPKHVRAQGVLDGVELFDAQFFGYTPQEARAMDPQHRLFLECGWHALENAGYHADNFAGAIGVFAGANFNQYFVRHVLSNPAAGPAVAFDKDFVATRLSYKLNLKGPSVVIQSACSTSLVAVAQACQSLLTFQCDMALAGGVAVHLPSRIGYIHQEGGILSPDGHCRAFDARARGTVIGSGLGLVVLKRLSDAITDRDPIRAVIRGFAINNDGSSKMGYMAPSIDGQAQVIAMAQAVAGVDADSVGYVEAHGTGTELGDPIEIAALAKAFRATTNRTRFCAVGSVKTNVGHLDSAAGVTGLIKAALTLEHKEIAPTLHFEQSNPRIDFADSPFFFNSKLMPWPAGPTPRRAGVSSFGIGGTNVHVVLEEAPPRPASEASRTWQILSVSARSRQALDKATTNLAEFLDRHPMTSLADAAYTLHVGRKAFPHRRVVVCSDVADAVASLRAAAASSAELPQAAERPVVFLLPGESGVPREYARSLYTSEPAFCRSVNRCADAFDRHLGGDLRQFFTAATRDAVDVPQNVLLFTFEFALSELFIEWGIRPSTLLADGLGELTAACVAGALTLRDAISLLVAVGRGSNADSVCARTIEQWASRLQLTTPRLPWISRRTGSMVSDAEACDRRHWARLALASSPASAADLGLAVPSNAAFLELGPGESLSALVRRIRHDEPVLACAAVALASQHGTGAECIARTLGQLWAWGVDPAWRAYHSGEERHRVALPTYPFESVRYWLDRPQTSAGPIAAVPQTTAPVNRDPRSWLYVPVWRRAASDRTPAKANRRWLVLADEKGVAARIIARIRKLGGDVISVRRGACWSEGVDGSVEIDPASRADYDALAAFLRARDRLPDEVALLWAADSLREASEDERVERELGDDFHSLLHLSQALGERLQGATCRFHVVAPAAYKVLDTDTPSADHAAVAGLCRVVAQEYPAISCSTLDINPAEWLQAEESAVATLVNDLAGTAPAPVVAYRSGERWVQAFERSSLDEQAPVPLERRGTYLITGGLGSIGLTFAGHLASAYQARLVLVGRRGLPARDRWSEASVQGDAQAHRIQSVEQFERAGAEVFVAAADVADEVQMRAVVAEAVRRFGRLDGVIHAAGLMDPGAFKPLRATDAAGCAAHFRAKIHGTRVLERVLEGVHPRFVLLTSSLSAVLGGLGFGAYAAANAFMDAFALARSGSGWMSVDWDGWRFGPDTGESNAAGAITAAAGAEALEWVLRCRTGQVAVSITDLDARMAKWVDLHPVQETAAAASDQAFHPRPQLQTEYVAPRTDLERAIAATWRDVLGVDPIGVDDNFFDLGGDSFRGLVLTGGLNKRFGANISPVSLYEAPTVAALAAMLANGLAEPPRTNVALRTDRALPGRVRGHVDALQLPAEVEAGGVSPPLDRDGGNSHDVAIIGMAGRFPGASTIDAFWENLRQGVEARSVYTDEQLKAAGISARVLALPRFVKSGFPLDDVDQFDAAFFGINPREAEVLDPQQRVFLECAWEALENAGYDSETYAGAIGVFGGSTPSSYFTNNVLRSGTTLKAAGTRQSTIGNVADYMVTRVAYKLNLKGPAYLVQTACSTSLVAVHLGCQCLRLGEADMVLAGGVSVVVPQRTGYLYEEGGMMSPDGTCRAFDANARGTAFGSGAGVVVLKRLRDAMRDGDHIYAVIKGGATNNDGSLKVGFTAPSVVGQAEVIGQAMKDAGVSPDTVSYVEAHGTGTELGDPIEVTALTRAYRKETDRTGYCALGSVKPNIGHLDAAAGVSSLIKTALALAHRELPPTINFERPNPKIDFDSSPFYVNTRLQPWPESGGPLRAGVSSFGFGGTNAHLVLEEAPISEPSDEGRSAHLLVLSARSESALDAATSRLADALRHRRQISVADVAYTLQVGRRCFAHRRALVCGTVAEALEALEGSGRSFKGHVTAKDRGVVFLFPGQGAQYVNMGLELYNELPVFRHTVDECAELFAPHLGFDLRAALYPEGDLASAAARLMQTAVAQAALFTTELALARMWMAWGIRPVACLGHSIGEMVAACLSGVLDLPDALRLVALRGRLMSQMPEGVMVAVPLPEERVVGMLDEELWLSAVNAPSVSIVSGRRERVDAFVARLALDGVTCHRLQTSHAFHSGLMDGAVDEFVRGFSGVTLRAPQIPFISNVTGDWITPSLAAEPAYWGRHIRQPVRFSEGVRTLLAESDRLMLEVGPGNTLGGLVRQHVSGPGQVVVSSLRHPQERTSDVTTVLNALGRLWTNGAAVDWPRLHAGTRRRRVSLPSYPFERQRYWVEPDTISPALARRSLGLLPQENLADWFQIPSWKRTPRRPVLQIDPDLPATGSALFFVDAAGLGSRLVAQFAAIGRDTIVVECGDTFACVGSARYVIDPRSRADYVTLLRELHRTSRFPSTIAHLWGVSSRDGNASDDACANRCEDLGFYSLLNLAQAIGEVAPNASVEITVVTDGVHEVVGREPLIPEKATVLGPCYVIPQEFPHVRCRNIDLEMQRGDAGATDFDALAAELVEPGPERVIALRNGRRWSMTFEPLRLESTGALAPACLRHRGVYLITGGTGGIGLEIARYLARAVRARLILTSRRGLPPRDTWPDHQALGAGDRTARQIAAVHALEAEGAEVSVVAADVSDLEAMRQVVDEAVARFGRINGVVHAAGVPGGGMIQLKKREGAAEVLRPKVAGARVLARVLDKHGLDFLFLCSSLAAVLGEVGQVDYCGANAYLDAFARHYSATTGVRAVSVNWTTWREVGMAVETDVPEVMDAARQQAIAAGLSNADGVEAFGRILVRSDERQIAMCPRDLTFLLEEIARPRPRSNGDGSEAAQQASAAQDHHPRPDLQTSFTAPRGRVQERICAIWRENLGIDRIGVDDNFFDLGGHSLLAVRVMARVNEDLGTDIPVAKLYEGLTVRFLAEQAERGEEAEVTAGADADVDSVDARADRKRRQKEHQQRRRALMKR